MKKNVAGQVIGAQMIDSTNGADFTGTVTVYVTGDAGTQTIGSVGSGVCTHEGRGLHTYLPAQAETNFDHVAFTFAGTNAITATVQVYPTFPQTGDNFARLGAPAGASVSADVAAVKVDTAATLVDTGTTLDARIPAALISGRMDASVGAMAANVLTAAAINADAITDAKVASDVTIASVTGSVGSVTGSVGSVTGLTSATVHADLDDIQARLPAALTAGGNIKADALAWNGLATVALPATPTNITAGTITTVTNLTNAPTAGDLTATMKASVNGEVVDALNVDTYAEPGQEAPPATTTLQKKISYLFKMLRNKKTQNATTRILFADDGTTVDHKATDSDDGTTYTKGELVAGP